MLIDLLKYFGSSHLPLLDLSAIGDTRIDDCKSLVLRLDWNPIKIRLGFTVITNKVP